MQKMTEHELQGFKNEFAMTCAAQDGDGRAWVILWMHYKTLMMSRLVAVRGLTREELESEAIEVFAYKLGSFNRDKVSSENAYSMFSWLWCAAINRTNKLIRQRKKEVHLYFEDVNANDDRDGSRNDRFVCSDRSVCNALSNDSEDIRPLQDQLIGKNEEPYNLYNPEKIVVDNLRANDTDRVRTFYARLSQFQKEILAARREGLTLAEVARKFCCSVSTIKNHIAKAKNCADEIFQVCYA